MELRFQRIRSPKAFLGTLFVFLCLSVGSEIRADQPGVSRKASHFTLSNPAASLLAFPGKIFSAHPHFENSSFRSSEKGVAYPDGEVV